MWFDFGDDMTELDYIYMFQDAWRFAQNSIIAPTMEEFVRLDDRVRGTDIKKFKDSIRDEWQAVFDDPSYPDGYMEKAFRRPSALIESWIDDKFSGSPVLWVEKVDDIANAFINLSQAMINQMERRKQKYLTPQ